MVSNVTRRASDGIVALKTKTANVMRKLVSSKSAQDVHNKEINKEIKKEKSLKKYDYLVIGAENSGKTTLILKISAQESNIASTSTQPKLKRTSSFIDQKKSCCLYEVDESLLLRYASGQEERNSFERTQEKLKNVVEEEEEEEEKEKEKEEEEEEEINEFDHNLPTSNVGAERRKVSRTLIETLDETSTGIIFCADVSSFESINKSLSLLKLVTEKIFVNKPLIVYLTKEKQLEQTLQNSSFKEYFPDFEGENNLVSVLNYLIDKKFVSSNGLTLTFLKELKDERQFLLNSSDEISVRNMITFSNLV